jgi:hypothetical protein
MRNEVNPSKSLPSSATIEAKLAPALTPNVMYWAFVINVAKLKATNNNFLIIFRFIVFINFIGQNYINLKRVRCLN